MWHFWPHWGIKIKGRPSGSSKVTPQSEESCTPVSLPFQVGSLSAWDNICSWSDRNHNQQSWLVTDQKAKPVSGQAGTCFRPSERLYVKSDSSELSEPTWHVHWSPNTQNTTQWLCSSSGTHWNKMCRGSFPKPPVRRGSEGCALGCSEGVLLTEEAGASQPPPCYSLECELRGKGLQANRALSWSPETEIPVPALANNLVGLEK